MVIDPELLQIIPADGWSILYEGMDGKIFKNPLACWGLFRHYDGLDTFTSVGGIDLWGSDTAGWKPAEDAPNFVAYEHSSQPYLALVERKQDATLAHLREAAERGED